MLSKINRTPFILYLSKQKYLYRDTINSCILIILYSNHRRALSNNLEDYGFLGVQAIEAICMSLMIGIVFFDLEFDQISVRDRFGLLYIVGALYPYMVILDVIGQCESVVFYVRNFSTFYISITVL